MKSIIKNEEKVVKSNYPCLKIYNNEGGLGAYVVLFTKPMRGIVVYSENERLKVGDNETANDSTCWAEECFTNFKGTIELSNN